MEENRRPWSARRIRASAYSGAERFYTPIHVVCAKFSPNMPRWLWASATTVEVSGYLRHTRTSVGTRKGCRWHFCVIRRFSIQHFDQSIGESVDYLGLMGTAIR